MRDGSRRGLRLAAAQRAAELRLGGATWVSIHHGGGVGIGYSQHAGMVIVCDGTPDAARRIERVLWNDPATGVMRHADAGYAMRSRARASTVSNRPGSGEPRRGRDRSTMTENARGILAMLIGSTAFVMNDAMVKLVTAELRRRDHRHQGRVVHCAAGDRCRRHAGDASGCRVADADDAGAACGRGGGDDFRRSHLAPPAAGDRQLRRAVHAAGGHRRGRARLG